MCCAGILVPRSAPRVLREALLKAGALVLLAAADVHLQVVSDGLDEGGRWSSSLHLARPVPVTLQTVCTHSEMRSPLRALASAFVLLAVAFSLRLKATSSC